MISRIILRSRLQMAEIIDRSLSLKSAAIISISSCESDKFMTGPMLRLLNSKECHDILILCFGDLIEKDRKLVKDKEFIFFDTEMARQIIFFLNVLRDKKIATLFIHCDAGVSRSGAVGIFAVRYLGLDEKIFVKENIFHPNSLVYDTLMGISGLRGDYDKFWEKYSDIDSRIIFI